MNISSKNNAQINNCLRCIEEQLGWGDSSDWSSRNFDQLSEKIHEQTAVTISHNTLKRLWGRIPYESNPSTFTLNTLAQFVGYENWSAFVASNSTSNTKIQKKKRFISKNGVKWRYDSIAIVATILIAVGLTTTLIISFFGSSVSETDYRFTSNRIADGLPNSVIFRIDASSSNDNDKIEIQQNWDSSKRQVIDRTDSLVTSLYYNPGYFDAKLVVNDNVVKEHSLLIPSNGWLATMETDKTPIYFEPTEFKADEGVAILPDVIKSRGVAIPENETFTNFFWVEDFKGLTLNDFTMETRLRNISFQNYRSCQRTHIIILCEGEAIIIPLSIKGCVADLDLFFLDRTVAGNRNDLSNFGVDFDTWVDVKCISKNGNFSIYINGKLAYEIPTLGKNNKIYGVKYRFQGIGAISKLKISNSNKIFIND